MGDRTSVTLYFPRELAKEAAAIADHPDAPEEDGDTACIQFSEVNYGNLDFLHKLRDAGIAYESQWSKGFEYGAGSTYGWFTPEGEFLSKDVYEADLNPPMNTLLIFIGTPVKLREYILEYKEKVAAPPWVNQVEYGKIYRTRKLIDPTN
jgi:hypothetical protein